MYVYSDSESTVYTSVVRRGGGGSNETCDVASGEKGAERLE
jgi:hypothetical protein